MFVLILYDNIDSLIILEIVIFFLLKTTPQLCMGPFTGHPSTLEAKAGELRIGGQSELGRKTLSQKSKGWGCSSQV
jgi:hypothetical protein